MPVIKVSWSFRKQLIFRAHCSIFNENSPANLTAGPAALIRCAANLTQIFHSQTKTKPGTESNTPVVPRPRANKRPDQPVD